MNIIKKTKGPVMPFTIGIIIGVLIGYLLFHKSQPSFEVICIDPIDELAYHPAIEGRSVNLKAVVRKFSDVPLEFSWEFGDGSEPVTGFVDDIYNLGVAHDYESTTSGRDYTAVLTVKNPVSGESHSDRYRIRYLDGANEVMSAIAREDALWFLHTKLERTSTGGALQGSMGGSYQASANAFAILAFTLNGYTSTQPPDHPYAETVSRLTANNILRLISVEMESQPAGDPDSNGNGIGYIIDSGRIDSRSSKSGYESPICTLALISDGNFRKVLSIGPEDAVGRTRQDIIIDLLDFLAYAQTDEGDECGGWRYIANSDADMSVTQWPVFAFMSAEQSMGIRTPRWVKSELLKWLTYVQDEDGVFGYDEPGNTTTASNASAIAGLIFCGVSSKDERILAARQAIADRWEESNIGDFYTMYSIMKASLLSNPHITEFGEHNWQDEYSEYLMTTQKADGSWVSQKHAPDTIATSLGVLILSPNLFNKHVSLSWFWSFIFLILLIAVIIYYRLMRKKRTAILRK